MGKKTRQPRTQLNSITANLRELPESELERVSGGLYVGKCPTPTPKPWPSTYTWPTDPDDIVDLD